MLFGLRDILEGICRMYSCPSVAGKWRPTSAKVNLAHGRKIYRAGKTQTVGIEARSITGHISYDGYFKRILDSFYGAERHRFLLAVLSAVSDIYRMRLRARGHALYMHFSWESTQRSDNGEPANIYSSSLQTPYAFCLAFRKVEKRTQHMQRCSYL